MIDNVTIADWPTADMNINKTGENYMEIEPVTGVMTKSVRSYTMVYDISCFQNSGDCSNYG